MSSPALEDLPMRRGAPRERTTRDRDEALVGQLRRGERGSAESLVRQYGERVYRLAFRITGNQEDAEEVAQDALWTAARKILTFKGEAAFGSWLYRITANTAYQKLRGRRGRDHAEISWDALLPQFDEAGHHVEPVADWSAKVQEPVLRGELRDVLSAAVDALPADYRATFLLHDVEGMPNPEIAKLLGISLPAVKSRIHRSRLFLRQRLARYLAVA
ncbi:MAG: sigma-70 family RNA polymerase sigma factor [Candidatus Rokubacteria bacterium]|nr:sigma-70 family RNA polymerase sigma factor [Candidatus Rokubacteria bacterium]